MIQTAGPSPGEKTAAPEFPTRPHHSDNEAGPQEQCTPAELPNKHTPAEWLSPFELSEESVPSQAPSARASNTGCLPMSFAEYLNLLDWTGRQLRADKRGAIPPDLAPILERLQIGGAAGWLQLMGQFSRLFRRAAGRPQSMQLEREQRGCRVMQGIRHSRAVFF